MPSGQRKTIVILSAAKNLALRQPATPRSFGQRPQDDNEKPFVILSAFVIPSAAKNLALRQPATPKAASTTCSNQGEGLQSPARGALARVECTARLCDVLHLVRKVTARRRWWKSLPVLAVERNGFLDNLTKLLKDGLFVRTVAPAVNQPRRTPDKALVLLGPLDDLRVSRGIFHDFDSSTARFTART